MDELRRNNAVQIKFNDAIINGTVVDYEHDRVMICVSFESVCDARKIDELDELLITVFTKMGMKKMKSLVISKLDISNCIVVENSPAVSVEQKREYVRVLSDLMFKIKKDDKISPYLCINISAGGIAFYSDSAKFEIGEEIDIVLPEYEFEKTIRAHAVIVKKDNNEVAAKFTQIDKHDVDKISKYVFKLISEK